MVKKKAYKKNKFYIFPFFFWMSCFDALLSSFICLLGMFLLGDMSKESIGLVIFCVICLILFPTILLFISLMFMMNTIEVTDKSIKRKRFGKITKEVEYDKVLDCGSIHANFHHLSEKNEKIGTFSAWCYLIDESKEFKHIEQLRMNTKVICFKVTPKTKKIFLDNCSNEIIKEQLFKNIILEKEG